MIADTHFGDWNVIRWMDRPFKTVWAMDRELIRRWNETVRAEDTVWHLGDFAKEPQYWRAAEILAGLNGHKRLILGNHDRRLSSQAWWKAGFEEIVEGPFILSGCVLSHEAVLPQNLEGRPNIHGHSHTKRPYAILKFSRATDAVRYFCVSAERTGFRPVDLHLLTQAIDIVSHMELPRRRARR